MRKEVGCSCHVRRDGVSWFVCGGQVREWHVGREASHMRQRISPHSHTLQLRHWWYVGRWGSEMWSWLVYRCGSGKWGALLSLA